MRKRGKMFSRHSRKTFRRGAGIHPRNRMDSSPMRGGIRL